MNNFSISELQQFSGIKAHTIRIWEQRYKALKPNRSEGNTRFYDNSQLKRLLNISSLINSEYKVSELCKMSDIKLHQLIQQHLDNNQISNNFEYYISQLISAGIAYDEEYVEKTLSNCIVKLGLKSCYKDVIYPMLMRVGLLWSMDKLSPSQEHFMSNIIRQKLLSVIDSLPPARSDKDAWLLFLPENEFHEFGLLFAQYMLRASRIKTIYLGSNVPIEIAIEVAKELSINNILLFLVHNNNVDDVQSEVNQLSNKLNKSIIHIAGNDKLIKEIKLSKKMNWLQSIEELEELIKSNV